MQARASSTVELRRSPPLPPTYPNAKPATAGTVQPSRAAEAVAAVSRRDLYAEPTRRTAETVETAARCGASPLDLAVQARDAARSADGDDSR